MRRLLGCLLVALALPGFFVPEPAHADTIAQSYALSAFNATNHARAVRGLHKLWHNDCLTRYAQAQARKQAAEETWSHQDLTPIMVNCQLRMAAENVAYGYSSGYATFQGWMHSPEHKANLLRPGYRQMGLAAVQGANGVWYVSQVFGRRL